MYIIYGSRFTALSHFFPFTFFVHQNQPLPPPPQNRLLFDKLSLSLRLTVLVFRDSTVKTYALYSRLTQLN